MVLQKRPWEDKRGRSRPLTHWPDDLKRIETNWTEPTGNVWWRPIFNFEWPWIDIWHKRYECARNISLLTLFFKRCLEYLKRLICSKLPCNWVVNSYNLNSMGTKPKVSIILCRSQICMYLPSCQGRRDKRRPGQYLSSHIDLLFGINLRLGLHISSKLPGSWKYKEM